MPKTILYTTDFLEASRQSLSWAVILAQQFKAHLTILYTYRLKSSHNGALQTKKKLEEDALKNYSLMEEQFLKGSGITYDFKVEVGFVSDRVEDYTRNKKVSFLVVDRNMSTNSKEAFDELVKHTQVPMVIVPSPDEAG